MIGDILYWIYTNVFHCNRRIQKFLFQEDAPRKTLDILIPAHPYPWLSISGVRGDTDIDVTDLVNSTVTKGQLVTPSWLESLSEETDIERWEYVDSTTFEVCEITSDGLVNEVKSKSD